MPLRNFLFLDTDALNDYLSTLEGALVEGPITETETTKSESSGKLGAGFGLLNVQGGLGSGGSSEIKRTLATTDAARFQLLFSLLEDSTDTDTQIQKLEAFDEGIWKQLSRGELLEVQSDIVLPKAFHTIQAMNNIVPFVEMMSALGQDPLVETNARMGFEFMRMAAQEMSTKQIPLTFECIGAPGFRFATSLPRKYIRCEISDLQGEATVFGKIQRIIPKGQQYESLNLLSALTSLPTMTTQQKQKATRDLAKQGMVEIVRGPAIVLAPVAIYR